MRSNLIGIRTTRWIALLACITSSAAAQRNFADVVFKLTPAGGRVSMLEGSGGNIGISSGEDGLLIIDDQFAPLAERIKAELDKLGGDLKYVLNTHYHADHTGGNEYFGKLAPIIAHDNVRKRLASGDKPNASRRYGVPVMTFSESMSIHFNGEEIRIVHFPRGHTDGDSVMFFKDSNVVHTGDHFFVDRFPFIDLGGGGSVQGYIRNVEKLLSEIPADAKIIPGHGPLATLDDYKRFHAMLIETTDLVRGRIAKGQTAEEIKKAGLPEKYADWGSGFVNTDRWISIIHKSLTEGE